ncbi:MAG: nucleotide excision repair endonuclease, partial [bacterium]|nr:nucleotide excision repair endonuclease [bacterium]
MRETLRKQAETLPHQPGVYVFRDVLGVPLYIGKANDVAHRIAQHLNPPHDTRHVQLLSEARTITFETCAREEEALLREQQLIKTFKPRY